MGWTGGYCSARLAETARIRVAVAAGTFVSAAVVVAVAVKDTPSHVPVPALFLDRVGFEKLSVRRCVTLRPVRTCRR